MPPWLIQQPRASLFPRGARTAPESLHCTEEGDKTRLISTKVSHLESCSKTPVTVETFNGSHCTEVRNIIDQETSDTEGYREKMIVR